MVFSPESISKKVIHEMIREDLDKAYFVLGEVYKTAPTYKSLHNFGVLLSKYGHEVTFAPRRCKKVAEKLLLSAKKQKDSFITNKELGDLFLSEKKFKTAITYYTAAYAEKQTFDLCYHLAECYFYQQQYASMKALLAAAVDKAEYSGSEKAAIKELYGFSCVFDGDMPEAVRMLRSLQTDKWYEITPETLKLAFLSGDYAFILQNYAAVYEGWIVQPEEYRIVYKAFQEAAADRLDEFETFRDTVVIPFCEENPNIDTTELMKAVTESGSSAEIPVTIVITPLFSCEFY